MKNQFFKVLKLLGKFILGAIIVYLLIVVSCINNPKFELPEVTDSQRDTFFISLTIILSGIMAWKFWKGLIVMFIIFLGLHLRTIDFNNLHFNNSSNSDSTIISNDKSVNGIYVGGDNSAKCEITINGDSWTGSTKPLTGVSDEWDNQNANVDYGTVNGKDLYDKTGSIKIGYVSGKSLHTTINGMSVTLYK